MVGLLLLWLVMECVCTFALALHMALFSNTSPTIAWVIKLAACSSLVARQLIRSLGLCLKLKQVSPLTMLHIAGTVNAMMDVPSTSFGSEPKWYCKTDNKILKLYNCLFPLPNQQSWIFCQPSNAITMRVISILRMSFLQWKSGRDCQEPGNYLASLASLPQTSYFQDCLHCLTGLQHGSNQDSMAWATKSELKQLLKLLQPLVRDHGGQKCQPHQSRWNRKSCPLVSSKVGQVEERGWTHHEETSHRGG